jgi:hypothetical protein
MGHELKKERDEFANGVAEDSLERIAAEIEAARPYESGNDDSEPIIPNYCPECGARVVSE